MQGVDSMNNNKITWLTLLLMGLFCLTSLAEVRLVLSAALNDNYYEFRKQQYIETLGILSDFGYQNPYIVEAIKKQGPTFLDEYTKNVFYSSANIAGLKNYGINEARTMLEGLIYFDFDDEDMIIKMTGRYQPISDKFFKLVEQNPDIDAFVKVDQWGNVFTLCFAMRYKHIITMYSDMNYNAMEQHMINVEHEVGNYIKKQKQQGTIKVMYIDRLDIGVNLLGSSTGNINNNQYATW